ncbi:tyrosine-type recombinase/integrase [Tumebacillus permanentifrigoris]|uniref:Integrase/recombinase XerD n=1 Tax=Tumebacillus permanentifrigoris TaxID=378543 RepID=A0A316DE53_9BACL|nr:tyrosine-type recombinase/integrase [Tumebacillus permanentifrigoris]PWK13947.1 integrase/recombinase XerD [Tumebacillus permanentifrigoris]
MDRRVGKKTIQTRVVATTAALDVSLDVLFEQFMLAKASENRAPRTLAQYRENYNFFLGYLTERGQSKAFQNVTTELLREYIVWMLHEKVQFKGSKYAPKVQTVGLSPVTVNTRLKTLRVLFGFLKKEKIIAEDPIKPIESVEEDENEVIVLTVEEMRRLFAMPDQKRFSDFRDYVLMNFLLDTFLRINEALSLKVTDVDLDSGMVTVRGEVAKSRKSRMVPLNNYTVRLLRELLAENQEFVSEYVFLANYGDPLQANQFRHRLREYSEEAGIKKRVHPHLFRHTGATMFLENGGDVRHLQMMLGHSDLRMVLRYTHLSKQSLKKQHEQFSPINAVRGKLNKERKIEVKQQRIAM